MTGKVRGGREPARRDGDRRRGIGFDQPGVAPDGAVDDEDDGECDGATARRCDGGTMKAPKEPIASGGAVLAGSVESPV